MTRTIYMKVSCSLCGYQGEMDGRTWSSTSRCPKCHMGTLERGETVRQKGTTLEKATEEAEHPAEVVEKVVAKLPEPQEVPVTKRYIGSGRGYVENYVEEGKSLEEITKLMEGKLAAVTVKVYYGYAVKKAEGPQVKCKTELPKKTKLGRPRPGEWVNCAGCGKKIYINLSRLEGKPADYPFRCEQCQKPGKAAKAVPQPILPVKRYKDMRIINIDFFEDFVNGLREDLELAPKTESTSGALIVIAQISGMLKMFKRDIYLK